MSSRFPIYERLLKLYPGPYRAKYGGQMTQTLADMLDDADGGIRRSLVWARVAGDLPLSIAKEQIRYTGEIMHKDTPHYVRRNALISAALITPFFVVLFSHIAQKNPIRHSDIWRSSLYITLVYLPLIAFLLALFTFVHWSKVRKISVWKNLIDLRRSWYLVAVGGLALLIALFVPFHDSTQCVTGNPVREVRNYQQTWRCIWRG